ncbi:hypothetical protein A3709_17055 [Halioglobus sp. HI00S01]|nr:hypothetical protein A3709_17055 [Halioglobus sp. HI00S01]
MLMGHYTTALVPWAYNSNRSLAPFWFFLMATQTLVFLMVSFALVGGETIEPSGFFDASFRHMTVDMTYSHDIAPVIVWTLVLSLAAGLIFKSLQLALIVAALNVAHELMDLLVSFKHYWFGAPENKDFPVFGWGLYNSAPAVGLLIEIAICVGFIVWYVRTRRRQGYDVSRKTQVGLYAVLVGFTVFLLPMVNQSLLSLVGG